MSDGIFRIGKLAMNQEKRSKGNWIYRKDLTALTGNKTTDKAVVKTLGTIQNRTSRKTILLIKFTSRKKFKIKFKEFRKRYGSTH
jgi:hypothetical protein